MYASSLLIRPSTESENYNLTDLRRFDYAFFNAPHLLSSKIADLFTLSYHQGSMVPY